VVEALLARQDTHRGRDFARSFRFLPTEWPNAPICDRLLRRLLRYSQWSDPRWHILRQARPGSCLCWGYLRLSSKMLPTWRFAYRPRHLSQTPSAPSAERGPADAV